MKLYPDRLFRDVPPPAGTAFADYIGVRIPIEDTHLCAYVMTPDGTHERPLPCVVLCHGFPGFCKSDDIAMSLCRMGCVVIVPGCRGGWSSGGFYSFTNYVADITAVAQWARSPEIAQTYGIDPDSILLSGHSMGGSSALNAARQLPWLKGVIAIAPYDIGHLFDAPTYGIDFLLEMGEGVLREETPGAIRRDGLEHQAGLSLSQAAGDLRERNLLLIGGSLDEVAPPELMIEPLWSGLQAQETAAVQSYIQLPSDHDFCSFRISLIEQIGNWIVSLFE